MKMRSPFSKAFSAFFLTSNLRKYRALNCQTCSPEKKEHHIHHFRWPLGVAAGIFLLLALAVSGLYVNHQKLRQYIANDTKYRNLKLIENKDLEILLHSEDSIYLANPDMRKQVLEKEAERERKLELLREAREKQQEAENLRKRAIQ